MNRVKLYKVELYINRLYRYCIGLNNLILNYTTLDKLRIVLLGWFQSKTIRFFCQRPHRHHDGVARGTKCNFD